MKIKIDFVTNSSSTCYIVLMPHNLKPITSVDQLREWDYDGHTEEEAIEIVNLNLTLLKTGEAVWNGDEELFWPTQHYLEDQGFILKSIAGAGGDGCDVIETIAINDIQATIKRYEDYENKN